MRRQIEHTADVAYEISGRSFLDLLEEAKNILLEEERIVFGEGEEKEKIYSSEETEDNFFDTVNDWILEISRGWAPWRVEFIEDGIRTVFKKIRKKEGTEVKALTYHLLNFERENETIKTKVVFDT
ncbi:archease [Thermotoga sp.]|uniref:archease n=1 Tax=Thermotoga sp. TaxID=28240 RepID=UPI0025F1FDEF|nr:archease [Thermotoga sp.]MCD6552167.1 archease [Thermotoga sp.]